MGFSPRKTIGFVLAIGFALQVTCASLASLLGVCPVGTVPTGIASSSLEDELPPCHKSSQTEDESSSSDTSGSDCCQKELTVSFETPTHRISSEKIKFQFVHLFSVFPIRFAFQSVSNQRQIHADGIPFFSAIHSPSVLQVFLI
ncbi:hypothetical protein LEP1GSC047_3820 [Leptospira inadai serovar Lyme str. 10]|uniref:Uncharacterized protein n=2 Tax=Leptospira inadai serovar Lyme TaxID=293084 RepID=V6HDA8_9LEPT|nr:hypothetical protein [Leptospira inadai]EQA37807.1 hypothetical protein LEP1GSC047_3820 [Leptospira inadai serovar Lyme str. 10]PNV76271.1 hypothetical protein BES34_004530 [Leptospira inadai serovar Lyme]